MAEPYDTLLQVQELDTELDQLRHRIEALPERAELADLRARRAVLVSGRSRPWPAGRPRWRSRSPRRPGAGTSSSSGCSRVT